MRYKIESLTLGGILDKAVLLLKNHFLMLLTVTLFLFVPIDLIHSFAFHYVSPPEIANRLAPTPEEAAAWEAAGPWLVVINLLYSVAFVLIASPLTNAAVIRAVANKYLSQPISAGGAFKHALKVFIPLILTGILAWLFITSGFLMLSILAGFVSAVGGPGWILMIVAVLVLAVQGVILFFSYWFTSHVVVIEGAWGLRALRRSKALMRETRGNVATAFVLTLLIALIRASISYGLEVVSGPLIPVPVALVVQSLLQAVLFVFGTAAGVVFYFSCRCKLEHFDLTILAESIGAELPGEAGEEPADSMGETR